MTVTFYADVNFPGPVVKGLKTRAIDILMAQEDLCDELTDEELLAKSTQLGRVLLTQDKDFFLIAKSWQANAKMFSGVLFTHHSQLSYRDLIEELEFAGLVGEAEDFANRIEVLPIR